MKAIVKTETPPLQVKPVERLAYSVHEVADMLGINYFSVYRLIVSVLLTTSGGLPITKPV